MGIFVVLYVVVRFDLSSGTACLAAFRFQAKKPFSTTLMTNLLKKPSVMQGISAH